MNASSERNRRPAQALARYEYRVWGRDLAPLFARIRQAGRLQQIEDSSETYIVTRGDRACNAKIRDGALDIKQLVRTHKRLEQWRPRLRKTFPLGRRAIREEILPLLRLDAHFLSQAAYDADTFLSAVIAPCHHLARADVSKRRYRFIFAGCRAEFTEVSIARPACYLETVAVESAELAAALRAVAALGLSGRENLSYPATLRRLLQMQPA